MRDLKLHQPKAAMSAAFVVVVLIVSTISGTFHTASGLASASLFEDGFESGSFSEWNGTRTTSGETASVTDILPHHNFYSARFESNGSDGIEAACCYAKLESDEVYVRGYVYLARGLPLPNDGDSFYLLRLGGTYNSLVYAGIQRTNALGAADRWMVLARNGSDWMGSNYADEPDDPLPQTGRWYCIELHWKLDSTAGLVELYVDGVRLIEIGGIDTDNYGNAAQVDFGLVRVNGVHIGLRIYADCFAASKTYIGTSCLKRSILGDVNLDGSVDLKDIANVARAFYTHPGEEGWNSNADLYHDDVINMIDLAIIGTQISLVRSTMVVGADLWYGTTASEFLSESHLRRMQQCGIQMVRLEFGRRSLANLRTLVPNIVNRGIRVLGILVRKDLVVNTNIDVWGGWVHSVVSEFKNYVHVWECWNEPNLDEFFPGADPVKYTNFLKRCYTEAKSADPTCTVLGGSIVFTQRSSIDFLTAMYRNGAKNYMDALSYHPYCAPYSPEYTNFYNAYSKLETQVRPIMVQNGDGDKKIWITEMGWATDDVTENQQATYLKQALTMAQEWGWVETFIIYKWIDSVGYYKGLLRMDGSPKPSFYAVSDFVNGQA